MINAETKLSPRGIEPFEENSGAVAEPSLNTTAGAISGGAK